MTTSSEPGWNWARTHRFTAERLHQPQSIDEVQTILAAATTRGARVRVVGSRHSFTHLADADELLDLSHLPEIFSLADDGTSATVSASMIYSRVVELLGPHHRALANLASLPHITVGGATATATHGSGDNNGNLATSVRALEIICADGEHRRIARGEPDFDGVAVTLGAVGVVVAIELDVEPAFQVEQLVHDDLSWQILESSFDQIFASAYSVSVFTDWRQHVQLWTKRREGEPAIDHTSLHDGTRAPTKRHPVVGESPASCTDQHPGFALWSERLPHFRAGATPSVGAEVQSEFFIDRSHAVEAIARLRAVGDQLAPALMASEIRTVAADDLWLSPQYERACVGLHFTWHHDVPAAHEAARTVATALAPLAPLPHWGKVFDATQFDFPTLYPRLADAKRVVASLDPTGTFQNAWMRETIP